MMLYFFAFYLSVGSIVALDYLLRLHFFNEYYDESWSDYHDLPILLLDMVLRWPWYLWQDIVNHYNPFDD